MQLEKFKKRVSIEIKLHVEHRVSSFNDIQSIQSILRDASLHDLQRCQVEVIASYGELSHSNWLEAYQYKNEPDLRKSKHYKQQKLIAIIMLHKRIQKLFNEW